MSGEFKSQATDSTGQWAISRAANARKVALRRLSEMHPRQFAKFLAEERVARNLSAVAPPKKHTRRRSEVSPGGDRRSVTFTFLYGDELRTLVAQNKTLARETALKRWGQWDSIESISTPDTIYNDLVGDGRMNLEERRGETR